MGRVALKKHLCHISASFRYKCRGCFVKTSKILQNTNYKRSQFHEIDELITERKLLKELIQDLAQKAPYFSVDAVRCWLAEQKLSYAPDTVKTYLSRQKKEGKIFDAGRGWYSSIAKPYELDTAPVEKLVGELKKAFPLLDFACWSTAQLNEMLRHQLAKHVQFAYVERDAIDSVADWLRDNGYRAWANPGKAEIKRSFSIEEKTAVVLPLTTKTPHRNGFATIEKIVVDVLADTGSFSIINIPEFIEGASAVIKSQRIYMSELMKYSTRRKTGLLSLVKGIVIH